MVERFVSQRAPNTWLQLPQGHGKVTVFSCVSARIRFSPAPQKVQVERKVRRASSHLSPLIRAELHATDLARLSPALLPACVCRCSGGLWPPHPNDAAVKSGCSPAPPLITSLQIHLPHLVPPNLLCAALRSAHVASACTLCESTSKSPTRQTVGRLVRHSKGSVTHPSFLHRQRVLFVFREKGLLAGGDIAAAPPKIPQPHQVRCFSLKFLVVDKSMSQRVWPRLATPMHRVVAGPFWHP